MYFRKFILNIKIVESKYFEILTYYFQNYSEGKIVT